MSIFIFYTASVCQILLLNIAAGLQYFRYSYVLNLHLWANLCQFITFALTDNSKQSSQSYLYLSPIHLFLFLSLLQAGFYPYFTETALVKVTSDYHNVISKDHFLALILRIFQAFDTVDYVLLEVISSFVFWTPVSSYLTGHFLSPLLVLLNLLCLFWSVPGFPPVYLYFT